MKETALGKRLPSTNLSSLEKANCLQHVRDYSYFKHATDDHVVQLDPVNNLAKLIRVDNKYNLMKKKRYIGSRIGPNKELTMEDEKKSKYIIVAGRNFIEEERKKIIKKID